MVGYEYNPMRATSNHGYVHADPYGHQNAGYTSSAVPGSILGYSKDGFPIRAASAPGSILGYSKDGFPIRAASVIDDMVCGGSSLLFIGIGLLVGWLATEKATEYMSKKRV
jgi:hypothetical protein